VADPILTVVGDVTRALLASGFTAASIEEALAMVGRALHVDRVYIFENGVAANGALTCSQRYEWCSNGASAQIDNPELQELPYDALGSIWVDLLSRDQVLCGLTREMDAATRAVLEPQDIRSILVCPITLRDRWWGFVGFDDCHSERSWSSEEVAVLKMLARALAGALRQAQIKQVLSDARSQLEAVAKHCSRSAP
jgi:GAF domain-containing protein